MGKRNEDDYSDASNVELSSRKKRKSLKMTRFVIFLILCAAAAGIMIFMNSPAQRVRRQISLGERYLADLDYEEAIVAFKAVLEKDYWNEEIKEKIGETYFRWVEQLEAEGEYIEAQKKYQLAVQYDGTLGNEIPATADSVTTWVCIWFGNYWQDWDSNGDGKVTQADEKEPIKWRVLDIDSNGDALLLSDKLIDIVEYNTSDFNTTTGSYSYTSVTWETCALRSFLNAYDSSSNLYGTDYSSNGFIKYAFSEAERNAIKSSTVSNPNNPVYNTNGGNATTDKIFCLSIDEAMNSAYGFVKNTFTQPGDSSKKYRTDDDPTRVAMTTDYTFDKDGYYGINAGSPAYWWLRSPGRYEDHATYVGGSGAVDAYNGLVHYRNVCVRPAFRMNLSSSSSLWSYAGTVSSDGTMVEIPIDSDY